MTSGILYVDAVLVIAVGFWIFLVPYGTIFHPLTAYLAFHIVVVTARAWQISDGAPTLLSVPSADIGAAVQLADVALVSAWLGSVFAGGTPRSVRRAAPPATELPPRTKSSRGLRIVERWCLPAGLLATAIYAYIPGVHSQREAPSQYLAVMIGWPAIVLIIRLYERRGSPWVWGLLLALVVLMALQGHQRFRALIPVILIVLISIHRTGRGWFKPRHLIVVGLAVLAFFPMKHVAEAAQAGTLNRQNVSDLVNTTSSNVTSGQNYDEMILDESALFEQLARPHAKMMGEPYLAVVALPVPRSLWPSKPGLNGDVEAVSTTAVPLATIGAVPTLAGDLLLNFGPIGVYVGPFLLLFWLSRLYRRVSVEPAGSPTLLLYLCLVATLPQIYRDGLTSLPVFMLVSNFPVLLYWVLGRRDCPLGPSRSAGSPPSLRGEGRGARAVRHTVGAVS